MQGDAVKIIWGGKMCWNHIFSFFWQKVFVFGACWCAPGEVNGPINRGQSPLHLLPSPKILHFFFRSDSTSTIFPSSVRKKLTVVTVLQFACMFFVKCGWGRNFRFPFTWLENKLNCDISDDWQLEAIRTSMMHQIVLINNGWAARCKDSLDIIHNRWPSWTL